MLDTLRVIANSATGGIRGQTSSAANNAGAGTDLQWGLGNIIQAGFYGAAIAAVIMIVISGVNYTMSRGDPNKVAKAKNTLIFSLIGLAIAVLAIAIVNFILDSMKEL